MQPLHLRSELQLRDPVQGLQVRSDVQVRTGLHLRSLNAPRRSIPKRKVSGIRYRWESASPRHAVVQKAIAPRSRIIEMEYIIGVLLALAVSGSATIIGFDRNRSFYPAILIVIASYYCLFAVMGGSRASLLQDAVIAMLFVAVAIAGFRTSPWLLVAALTAHGTLDLVHHHIILNAGTPAWWPGFCFAFDIAAASFLALQIAFGNGIKNFQAMSEGQSSRLLLPTDAICL